MLTGVFASAALGGKGLVGDISILDQVIKQGIGVGTTLVYTAVISLIILKVVDWTIGLRVTEEQETEGLDLALHDERGYIL
jgi:Amt family ammonium transporter